MKNLKKILAIALVAISLFAVALPAMAGQTLTGSMPVGPNTKQNNGKTMVGELGHELFCSVVGDASKQVRVTIATATSSSGSYTWRVERYFYGNTAGSLYYNAPNTKTYVRPYAYYQNAGSDMTVHYTLYGY